MNNYYKMFKYISHRITKTWIRNSSSKSPGNYLNTVLKITFPYGGEKMSGNILLHDTKPNYSNTLNDQIQSCTSEFIKRYGFTSVKDVERANAVSYYSLTACPSLTVDSYVILANAAATHLLIDEIFDDELLDTKYAVIVEKMCKALCKHFRCDAIPIGNQIRDISPKFENICRMYFDLGKSLLATGRDISWVYQEFDNFINSYATEVMLPRPISSDEYLTRKKRIFGMRFYFELLSILAGESLSTEMRNSAWLKDYRSVMSTLPPLCSDLTSFIYDTSVGKYGDNYTVILTTQGMSVKEAFKETIFRYNQFFIDSVILISKLDKNSISEADKRYLNLYLTNIRAALDWATHFNAYNQHSQITYQEIYDELLTVSLMLFVQKV